MGGVRSAVYATETSVEEYLTYTTEETEKLEVTQMTEKLGGNMLIILFLKGCFISQQIFEMLCLLDMMVICLLMHLSEIYLKILN